MGSTTAEMHETHRACSDFLLFRSKDTRKYNVLVESLHIFGCLDSKMTIILCPRLSPPRLSRKHGQCHCYGRAGLLSVLHNTAPSAVCLGHSYLRTQLERDLLLNSLICLFRPAGFHRVTDPRHCGRQHPECNPASLLPVVVYFLVVSPQGVTLMS